MMHVIIFVRTAVSAVLWLYVDNRVMSCALWSYTLSLALRVRIIYAVLVCYFVRLVLGAHLRQIEICCCETESNTRRTVARI